MIKKLLPMGTALFLTICFIFVIDIYLFLTTPAGKKKIIKNVPIARGTSFTQIAEELKKKKIIRDMRKFSLLARLRGDVSTIKAGEYALNTAMTPLKVLAILTKGVVIRYKVTIPEGFDIYQVASLLGREGVVNEDLFVKKACDPSLLSLMEIEGSSFEGYLFPDTYYLTKDIREEEIIMLMANKFKNVFSKNYALRSKEMGLTEREVTTLASIIEKETANRREKYLISAVFHNRLNRGIRLQSDPTVIYGLRPFNGNLTRKDLRRRTPYNTYRIKGLPTGPISNPGKESLKAALCPADVNYLYFVSKNNGTHHFSVSLAEHNQAVAIYQRNKRDKKKVLK